MKDAPRAFALVAFLCALTTWKVIGSASEDAPGDLKPLGLAIGYWVLEIAIESRKESMIPLNDNNQ